VCDCALEVSGIQSLNQMLGQHLTRPLVEEEVAEHKATFLVALKGLNTTRKYMCEFGTEKNIIVICSTVENELYRLRAQGERKLLLNG
jgi:hypothetical protein